MQLIKEEIYNIQILLTELREYLKNENNSYDNYFEEIITSLSFICGYAEGVLEHKSRP